MSLESGGAVVIPVTRGLFLDPSFLGIFTWSQDDYGCHSNSCCPSREESYKLPYKSPRYTYNDSRIRGRNIWWVEKIYQLYLVSKERLVLGHKFQPPFPINANMFLHKFKFNLWLHSNTATGRFEIDCGNNTFLRN